MESLIHHFKIVTRGLRVPEGEVYVPVESPRGELGCYVVSDGGPKPVAREVARAVVRSAAGDRDVHVERVHRGHDRDRRLARHRDGRGRPVSALRDEIRTLEAQYPEADSAILPALRLAQERTTAGCRPRRSARSARRSTSRPRTAGRSRPSTTCSNSSRSASISSRSARTSRARCWARSDARGVRGRARLPRRRDERRRQGHAARRRVLGGCGFGPVIAVDERYHEPVRPEDARRSSRSCGVAERIAIVLGGTEHARPDLVRRVRRARAASSRSRRRARWSPTR